MTRDEQLFNNITYKQGGNVVYGDHSKGKIIGIGSICFPNFVFENIVLVDGLKHNLISISQLCDKGNKVYFNTYSCEVSCLKTNEVKIVGNRINNVYIIYLDLSLSSIERCLVSTISQNTWLWHNRLGHASMNLVNKLSKHDLVKGLPKLKYERDHICDACMKAKQINISFKPTNEV